MSENQLGQKLKTLRKRKGYSQEALAKISGLSLRTVQRIENENRNPSGDTLKRLSTALGISPDYLLEWEPNENHNFLILLAFSPILFIINPFLAILIPLILWSIKKNQIRGVKNLGVRILKIQIIWLVSYFIFRTLNFLRLNYSLKETQAFYGDEWDYFLSDLETHSFLKTFFNVLNGVLILVITYKTYRNNQSDNSKITINSKVMKSSLLLISMLILSGCNEKTQMMPTQYIEPSNYHIMSYQVKDVKYHDSVAKYISDDSYITIIGDSTFNITSELGEFLFKGNNFVYTIINDSLILSNTKKSVSYKLLEIDPNSFKLEVDNKYFDRIDMVKPKDKRRKIEKTVEIDY